MKTMNLRLSYGKIQREPQKYFPYKNTRRYQGELTNIIYQAVRSGKHLVVEAPAGLGKTIAALSACLPVAYERNLQILYCCRTHQQMLGVLQELEAIRAKGIQVTGMGLYGKKHLCANELLLQEGTKEPEAFSLACSRLREAGRCPLHAGSYSNPRVLSDLVNELLRKRFGPAEVRQLCRSRGLCPFDVASTALPYAKVVTLSYHYLFNPWMRSYLLGRVHRTLDREILVVDEAHNVPRIAAQSESKSLSLSTVERAVKESREHGFHEIGDVCHSIHSYFSHLEMPGEAENIRICLTDFEMAIVNDKRSNSEINRVIRAMLNAGEMIQQMKLINEQAPISHLYSVGRFLSQTESRLTDPTYIIVQSRDIDRGGNERRRLEAIQLLSRRVTEHVFSSVFSSLSMSGTLQPLHVYSKIVGLPKDALGVAVPYPFPKTNALVLISDDVSTRQKERNAETFAKVARIMAETSRLSPGNVAVFLASHEVLNDLIDIGVESLLKTDFEVLTERRYMPSSEIDQLYRSFLRPSNSKKILLAVQGGRLSVAPDEPLLIKDGQGMKIVKIGEFVDAFIGNKDPHKKVQEDYRVASFDDDYRISLKPVSKVIKHRIDEPLYKLTLQTGREVKATGCHSVYTISHGLLMSVEVKNLKVGDYVVVPIRLPNSSAAMNINLVSKLLNQPDQKLTKIYVKGVSNFIRKGFKRLGRYDTVALKLLRRREIWNGRPSFKEACIHVYHSNNLFPPEIPISNELMRLLGYYVSEGCCSRSGRTSTVRLSFGSHEEDLVRDAKRCVRRVFGFRGIRVKRSPQNEIQVFFGGRLGALVFSEVFRAGKDASTKRVPPIVFNVCNDFKLEFLKACMYRDGTACKGVEISYKTTSKDLASDLQYLFLQLGLVAGVTRAYSKRGTKTLRTYQVYVTNADQLRKLVHIIPRKSLSKVKKASAISDMNKKRRCMLPTSMPVAESGLRKLWDRYAPGFASPANINRARIRQRRLKRELAREVIKYIKIENEGGIDAEFIEKIIEGDLGFAQITNIDKIAYNGYVYDISVPNYENFVGGVGGVVLHNSEGVDYIGNKIKTIMVVGVPYAKPSLPVSAQIELYRKFFGKKGRFYAYIVPALWSSLQAAGRGIRSSRDTCAIMLLDRRFSREPLLSTLPGWMRERLEKTSLRDGSVKRRLILFFCSEVLQKRCNRNAISPHEPRL